MPKTIVAIGGGQIGTRETLPIDREIIRLSKKYKFVTPYTSFLAVPRALLRPRVIRPGDPVLRIKTDPSIASVIALFPFGLVKPLRYLKDEDTWRGFCQRCSATALRKRLRNSISSRLPPVSPCCLVPWTFTVFRRASHFARISGFVLINS